MDTNISSVIFLAFLVIIPLGMITGIVILIVRKAGGRSGLKSIAQRLGWEAGSGSGVADQLYSILEPTIFAMRKGRHTIKDAVSGVTAGARCWMAEYHYQAPGPARESRRGGVYSLLVIERKSQGSQLMIQHRQSGALAAVAEKLAAGQMSQARAPEWSWALTSSDEILTSLPLAAGTGELLRKATIPGDMVFLFPGLVVWSRPAGLARRWAQEVPEMISLLGRFQ